MGPFEDKCPHWSWRSLWKAYSFCLSDNIIASHGDWALLMLGRDWTGRKSRKCCSEEVAHFTEAQVCLLGLSWRLILPPPQLCAVSWGQTMSLGPSLSELEALEFKRCPRTIPARTRMAEEAIRLVEWCSHTFGGNNRGRLNQSQGWLCGNRKNQSLPQWHHSGGRV